MLNYLHLHHFWVTAREGGLAAASRRLRLSPSTLSTQIRALEQALGRALFDRSGRSLVLTEMGRLAVEYADEIFGLGTALIDTLEAGQITGRPLRLRVGVADIVPKLVAYRLLAPATDLAQPVHLSCKEDSPDGLVADLALHHLDLVLSDAPVGLAREVHATSRVLGHCGITFFGTERLVARWGSDFPRSLDGAPMLLPAEHTTLRRSLEVWFERTGVEPEVVGEFADSALLKAFGQHGAGLFPMPSVIRDDVAERYGVVPVGEVNEVQERFYAITMSRRLDNPGVKAIVEAAARALDG